MAAGGMRACARSPAPQVYVFEFVHAHDRPYISVHLRVRMLRPQSIRRSELESPLTENSATGIVIFIVSSGR